MIEWQDKTGKPASTPSRQALPAGLSLSWLVLVGPDQHSRKPTRSEKKKKRNPTSKKIKKMFFYFLHLFIFIAKISILLLKSSKIG